MSFAREVKVEICQNNLSDCCKKSFISAIIKMNSSLSINNQNISVNISFTNVAIIKRIYELIKELYNIDTQIIVTKQMKLKKQNHYTLKMVEKSLEILSDLKVMEGFEFMQIDKTLVKNPCCKRAYIAGSFVASGSVNSPNTSNYHLEIQGYDIGHIDDLQKLITSLKKGREGLSFNFKKSTRRNAHIIYLKSAYEIVDFLNYVGATVSTFKYEDIRVQRDFMNSINRMNNMDVANEMKTLKAADKQLLDIKTINDHFGITNIDNKLVQVINLRLDNPNASLNELCELYNQTYDEKITKSGMNHRFRKIKDMASKIKEVS